jgi:two-component system nitrate/nitrite response regulator NarL
MMVDLHVVPSSAIPAQADSDIPTVIVSPHEITRAGLRAVLASTRYRVVQSSSRVDGLDCLRQLTGPVLLIAAASSPRVAEDVRAAKEGISDVSVLILRDRQDPDLDLILLKLGASGFVDPQIDLPCLIRAAESVLSGHAVLTPEVSAALVARLAMSDAADSRSNLRPQPRRSLSAREAAILECLADGVSNKLIARRLDITEGTVKVHVKGILRKIGAQNRTQAALWARGQHPVIVASVVPS